MASSKNKLIVIRGAGDIGSGVAYRLHKAGYAVLMTELSHPLFVRRMVSFGNAVYTTDKTMTVEGITSRHVPTNLEIVLDSISNYEIPILTDEHWTDLEPAVVIDARLAKRNIDTSIDDAPLVIALGPGFSASEDCHAVIETNRGHFLGRVIWKGPAEPNTGLPGTVQGKQATRVLRAPCAGYLKPRFTIGDKIETGQVIATVQDSPIIAAFDGILRGLVHESVEVSSGFKVGDLDPRGIRDHSFTISDKALSIGGGVLEALLSRRILPD